MRINIITAAPSTTNNQEKFLLLTSHKARKNSNIKGIVRMIFGHSQPPLKMMNNFRKI
jgi:hypothetical protein